MKQALIWTALIAIMVIDWLLLANVIINAK